MSASESSAAEQAAALSAIRELIDLHFGEAADSAGDDGKFSISFRARFDRGSSPTKVKVVSRISHTAKDEIEISLDDPRQGELPL